MAPGNSANEIRIVRVYDAPVKSVWDAWADAKRVARWWGPRGFTLTTHSKDLRSGGHWHYTMHGPDGVDYENKIKYHEVDARRRLVYDHGGNDDRPPLFHVTALFADLDGKTRLEMTMALSTPEAAVETKKRIRKLGGESTWDRLAEFLEKEATGKERFVVNRSFAAPIDVVFEMWTEPHHMAKWTPPAGATMAFINADVRPGGSSFYKMDWAGGSSMYGKVRYLEVRKPDRIVYTQQFSDEKGNVARHPMAPTWPETMLTVVTLSEEGPSQTRVTVQWEPHGEVTSEELATFVAARAGMTGGWTGSFDKLDDTLPARPS